MNAQLIEDKTVNQISDELIEKGTFLHDNDYKEAKKRYAANRRLTEIIEEIKELRVINGAPVNDDSPAIG